MDRFPVILFTGFFLLVLASGMIFAIRGAEKRSRWQWFLFSAFGLAVLVLTLTSRTPAALSGLPLSGAYIGDYGGGTNTFLLHPDGTFDQCFVDDTGREYRNQGTWEIADDSLGLGNGVNFNHMLDTVDGFGRPQKPELTNSGNAALEFDSSINFDEDNDISIERVSQNDRQWPWESDDEPPSARAKR